MTQKKTIQFDLDSVIEKYNKENPDLRQLDQKSLAKQIGNSPQTFTKWKSGNLPESLKIIVQILKITGSKFEDLFVEVNEKN